MAIEVRGLKKSYDGFDLDLDFRVEDGETLVLVGPSGCGKTTALNLIVGLTRAEGGSILIDGEDMGGLPPWKRNIAVVFQDLALFPHLNVGQNIAYGPFIHRKSRLERRHIIEETLKIVRLSGYGKRRVETLSGGERQRAAIARALGASPRALLLDEPFSSLDAPLRARLRREFRELRSQSKLPCVFVTHDREEAAIIADRIALMSGGRVRETGPARDLFLCPKTSFGARFFGAGSLLPGELSGGPDEGGRVRVESPLGSLRLPLPFPSGKGRPLVYVPHDAVSLAGDRGGLRLSPQDGEEGGGFILRTAAILKAALFEGDKLRLELELPGGVPLSAVAGPRFVPPPPGSTVLLLIRKDLLHLVE